MKLYVEFNEVSFVWDSFLDGNLRTWIYQIEKSWWKESNVSNAWWLRRYFCPIYKRGDEYDYSKMLFLTKFLLCFFSFVLKLLELRKDPDNEELLTKLDHKTKHLEEVCQNQLFSSQFFSHFSCWMNLVEFFLKSLSYNWKECLDYHAFNPILIEHNLHKLLQLKLLKLIR